MQEKIETISNQVQNIGLNNLLKAEPVQAQERIEVLDVIRGFALLGILMANMAWFSTPALYFEMLGKNISTGIWDTTAIGKKEVLLTKQENRSFLVYMMLLTVSTKIYSE